MNLEDLLTSGHIRSLNRDLSVESSGSENGRIQNINPVSRCHDDYSRILGKAVHFDEKLVKSLFSFIMSAAKSGSAPSGYGVYLINEYDTGAAFLGFFEQIPYS